LWPHSNGDAGAPFAAPPSLADQLRYIGRDGATGMSAVVDDRYISDTESAIARYGKDEREAVLPPTAGAVTVTSVTLPALRTGGSVAPFGIDRFGRLDVPQDSRTIAWHPAYGALPGAGAATFFAAHYEFLGVPGVFFGLSRLAVADEVSVTLSDGLSHRYRVTSAIDYALAAIDMGAILQGREGTENITLMTCSGPANEGEYPLRTVVLAERIQ
ncbi:MAG: class F sortase, partial [Tepidiformaceae bacterium]